MCSLSHCRRVGCGKRYLEIKSARKARNVDYFSREIKSGNYLRFRRFRVYFLYRDPAVGYYRFSYRAVGCHGKSEILYIFEKPAALLASYGVALFFGGDPALFKQRENDLFGEQLTQLVIELHILPLGEVTENTAVKLFLGKRGL